MAAPASQLEGIFLSLGSNMGIPAQHLAHAREALPLHGISLLTASPVYRTKAWGNPNQPDFLNQVLAVHTTHSPQELLQVLLYIEKGLGRVRYEHWGPRVIDIDLLAYNQHIMNSPQLQLPHPYLQDRAFVLVPWADIAPRFLLPGMEVTVEQLVAVLPPDERGSVQPQNAL